MMKPVVIFGAGSLARLACACFREDSPHRVAAFTVHQQYMHAKSLMGVEFVPFESIREYYPPEAYAVFVAVGFGKHNRSRAEIYEQCKSMGYEMASYISSRVRRWESFEAGENCMIFDGVVINPFVSIGNDVIINSGTVILHDSKVGDHCFLGANVLLNGENTIGEYCTVGADVTVVERVSIGRECVVSAGKMVTKDMGPGTVE
jgi:sugar O-acyltransferase (sialic acid O-acetyltransferase NeuD family)